MPSLNRMPALAPATIDASGAASGRAADRRRFACRPARCPYWNISAADAWAVCARHSMMEPLA